MKLYYWPMSHNARKVRILSRILNLGIEEISLSMSDGDHKKAEFLALNPMGQVPTLSYDGGSIWGGNAILAFLADHAASDLGATSSEETGQIFQWMFWQTAELAPVVVPLHVENYFKRVRGIDADKDKVSASFARLNTLLSILNSALDNRAYLVGQRLTIADLAIASDFSHAGPAGFPIEDFPAVKDWLKSIQALDAWSDTAPPVIG